MQLSDEKPGLAAYEASEDLVLSCRTAPSTAQAMISSLEAVAGVCSSNWL